MIEVSQTMSRDLKKVLLIKTSTLHPPWSEAVYLITTIAEGQTTNEGCCLYVLLKERPRNSWLVHYVRQVAGPDGLSDLVQPRFF